MAIVLSPTVLLFCNLFSAQQKRRTKKEQIYAQYSTKEPRQAVAISNRDTPWHVHNRDYLAQAQATRIMKHSRTRKHWVVPKSYRPKGQPRSTRNEFPIRADLGNSRKHPIWRLKCGENWQLKEPFYRQRSVIYGIVDEVCVYCDFCRVLGPV